ncbi:MAG: 23S rRNA (guanosine(2251)-2'-O)-methyltransferase RlmB [Elusimicrobia bacterium]|nr:23S rRNA (guanosine(2251)-2'-O)-methyltransferase RlmB [Elusimicrobiota bacterium]
MKWIAGRHSVEETLRAKPDCVRELWVQHEMKNPAVSDLVRLARSAGVRVQFRPGHELDRVTGGAKHQGFAIKVEDRVTRDFFSFLKGLNDESKKGLVLVALDQIQDPHNLGAIARSAANLGARGLILPERRAAPVTPTSVQASAGAIQKIEVFTVVNVSQALDRAKGSGFWIYGADASGRAAWDTVINIPLILVIGSEGRGLRPLVRASCDELLSVPQSKAGVESLNASCAATALLYEIARQAAHA